MTAQTFLKTKTLWRGSLTCAKEARIAGRFCVGLIAILAYAASLLTTYLPAWQAARIYPAEALRYE